MRPIHLFAAATSLLSSALMQESAFAQNELVYLDDRSSPRQLIHSLYNAINRHEYGRAYSYFGTPPAESFEQYEAGFSNTEQVEVLTGVAIGDPGAGTTYYTVPVAIRSTDTRGESKVFAGCYTLKLSSPSAQTTPFTPLYIDEGSLRPAEGELEDALPTRCNDNEEPRDQNALLLERARNVFHAAFSEACTLSDVAEEEPQHYPISFRYAYAEDSAPDETIHLFRFFCSRGAYNETHAYLMVDSIGNIVPVSFAAPEMHIEYEDDDGDKAATDMRIVGFHSESTLINSDYDPETYTITSHAKWRGLGDAFTAGRWLFRQGQFSLVKYEIDPSTDGEIEPVTVLDYDLAP